MNLLKEVYVKLAAGHKYGYHDMTITHNLLWYNPRFL